MHEIRGVVIPTLQRYRCYVCTSARLHVTLQPIITRDNDRDLMVKLSINPRVMDHVGHVLNQFITIGGRTTCVMVGRICINEKLRCFIRFLG